MSMTDRTFVIFGTGPVGSWTARALVDRGLAVRAVNRSGARPELLPQGVEIVAADASDPDQARAAAEGATAVIQALNPPYDRWHELFPDLQANVLAAAETVGARYVSIENLYMYDPSGPIREETPIAPRSRKGALRQRMAEQLMAVHAEGRVRVTALRSSDYYGPGVTDSAWGERVFAPLVEGKPAQATGALDVPHSVAFIQDVGRAAAELATRDAALGRAWIAPHAPARTAREMIEIAAKAAGVEPKARGMGTLMMRIGGLFIPAARASVEMMYQFERPFEVDASRIEREFGLTATPLAEGLARTVAWYRRRGD
jgi:nucleoside-diphosphate-sugar epimerase